MEKIVSRLLKITFAVIALSLPALGWAQGKIAVVNLQEAILQTDLAQKRLGEVRSQSDYKSDKKEFDKLKDEFDKLVKDFQKDAAVMSQELSPRVQEVLRDLIKSEGIGLLLQRSAVIHADAGYSITAKVTDLLNQKASK